MKFFEKPISKIGKKILVFVLVLLILLMLFFIIDGAIVKKRNDDMLISMLRAAAADPGALTVKTGNGKEEDITDEFLNMHLSEIEGGNYSTAMDDIRSNKYGLAIQWNEKTREYVE